MGIQQAFIQNPRGDERAFLNTAWTIRAARGVVLWLIAMLIAYPMALVYGQSELFGLLCVGCLPSLVLGFQSTETYTLRRRIELGWITLLEVLTRIVNVVVMIAWASQSATVWARNEPLGAYLSE